MASMMSWILGCLVILLMVSVMRTQECRLPDVPVVDNFNKTKFLGKWFAQRWYPGPKQLEDLHDVTMEYYIDEGTQTNQLNSNLSAWNATSKKCFRRGDPILQEIRPGVYSPVSAPPSGQHRGIFYVVDTDYDTYYTRMACREVGNICEQPTLTIFSRTKGPMKTTTMTRALQNIPSTCVKMTDYKKAIIDKERGCDRNLRVPCALSDIPIQKNFDESKYMGLWFEVVWYAKNHFEPRQTFFDHTFVWEKEQDHVNIKRKYRFSPGGKCNDMDGRSNQLRPGVYEGSNTAGESYTTHVVYTDYTSFSVEFVCYQQNGGSCTNPSVQFVSRTKFMSAENMALGKKLVADLCVDPTVYAKVLQQPALTCVRNIKQPCDINDVPIQHDFKLYDFLGHWYTPFWYPRNDFEPHQGYIDHSVVARRKGNKLLIHSNGRFSNSDSDCSVDGVSTLVPSGPSTYTHERFPEVVWKIAYTDYKNFAMVFICYNFGDSNNCTNSEVSIYSRHKKLRSIDQGYVDREINRLCVDPAFRHQDLQKNACAVDITSSRRIRSHCYRVWRDTCRQWRSLWKHCYWTPLRCSYYRDHLTSCYYEWDRCDQGLGL